MKGRKPQSAGLKALKGERPDRMPAAAPPPPPSAVPEPPPYLGPEASAKWAELAPGLADEGLLGLHGSEVLALYCEAFGRWRIASDELRFNGLVLNTDLGGTKANPAAAIALAASRQMQAILAEWVRQRAARTVAEPPKDELGEFLNG